MVPFGLSLFSLPHSRSVLPHTLKFGVILHILLLWGKEARKIRCNPCTHKMMRDDHIRNRACEQKTNTTKTRKTGCKGDRNFLFSSLNCLLFLSLPFSLFSISTIHLFLSSILPPSFKSTTTTTITLSIRLTTAAPPRTGEGYKQNGNNPSRIRTRHRKSSLPLS